MTRSRLETTQLIERQRAVAIIRLRGCPSMGPLIDAIEEGGIHAIELTMTTPGCLAAITELASASRRDCLIGAGTVLDEETARLAILAGADFVVGPMFCPGVLRVCHRYDIAAIPGAFTPTEVLTACDAGADMVKLFPACGFGPGYVRDLLAPLPHVRLITTGGVTFENACAFLEAGAVAVGFADCLVDEDAVALGDYARITDRARRAMATVAGASVASR